MHVIKWCNSVFCQKRCPFQPASTGTQTSPCIQMSRQPASNRVVLWSTQFMYDRPKDKPRSGRHLWGAIGARRWDVSTCRTFHVVRFMASYDALYIQFITQSITCWRATKDDYWQPGGPTSLRLYVMLWLGLDLSTSRCCMRRRRRWSRLNYVASDILVRP